MVFCLVLLPGLVVPWAMDGSVFVRCLGDGFDFDALDISLDAGPALDAEGETVELEPPADEES